MPMPLCPVAPTFPADFTAPIPETLSYSLTLPAALASPALARAATREILKAHGLHDMLDPALQAVGELTAVAAQFTQSPDFYLSLRYRASTLRVIAYDNHPRHTNPASPPPATPAAEQPSASSPASAAPARATGASESRVNRVVGRGCGRRCRGRGRRRTAWGIREPQRPLLLDTPAVDRDLAGRGRSGNAYGHR